MSEEEKKICDDIAAQNKADYEDAMKLYHAQQQAGAAGALVGVAGGDEVRRLSSLCLALFACPALPALSFAGASGRHVSCPAACGHQARRTARLCCTARNDTPPKRPRARPRLVPNDKPPLPYDSRTAQRPSQPVACTQ